LTPSPSSGSLNICAFRKSESTHRTRHALAARRSLPCLLARVARVLARIATVPSQRILLRNTYTIRNR
jgi:hypothetical protein